jgi:hypothetical protein
MRDVENLQNFIRCRQKKDREKITAHQLPKEVF